tara:strand:+ start:43359 stop:44252 length:894 start_codon:yes stop_codon:yes gene_type:complete
MIVRFFKFTKLTQVILAAFVSILIMAVLKNQNISSNDFGSIAILIIAFLLSLFIISKNSILKNNQFTTLGLIFFSGVYFKTTTNLNVELSYLFLLLSIRKVYSLISEKKISKKFIDIGCWLAVSVFLNPFNIIFLFTIFFGIYMFYRLDILGLLKIFIGFLATILILFFCLSLTKESSFNLEYFNTFIDDFLSSLVVDNNTINNNYIHLLPVIALTIIFIIYLFKYFGSNLIERKKNFFLIIFFLNSFFLIFLINEYSIFLFFPFLITLTKIISELRINLLVEIMIIILILINSYPF